MTHRSPRPIQGSSPLAVRSRSGQLRRLFDVARRCGKFGCHAGAMLWASLAWAVSAYAAPSIDQLNVRGLQVGATTVVTITGSDLGPDCRLLLPFPIGNQAVRPGATPQRIEFEVTLSADLPAGIYPLRVTNPRGVSNLVLIGIDRLPQQEWADTIDTLPTSRHAPLAGERRLSTRVTGKKGQRLVVDVEAQRLGSPVRPVVRLYDARGIQIAWGGPTSELSGDARIAQVLPADGVYQIEIHDVLYRAPGSGFVRVNVGDLLYSDAVLPSGVTLGQKQSHELLMGTTQAGLRADFDATNLTVPTVRPLARPVAQLWTGPSPRVVVSDFPELDEASSAMLAQPPQAPFAFSGRIGKAGEEDRFTFTVTAGSRLQFDVQARSLGSPLDGVLSVVGPQGNGLANNDDRPGTPDPGLDFTVPAGVDKLTVVLHDLQRRGGPDFFYRLVVRDLGRPEFSLSYDLDRVHIPRGGSQLVTLQVNRQGYNDTIKLAADALPPGVQMTGETVPAGASLALIALTAADDAPLGTNISRWLGRTPEGGPKLTRYARQPDRPANRLVPWTREELAVAVTEATPIRATWVAAGDESLPAGGKLPIKIALRRDPATNGNLNLRLVTTQPTPKKTVKQNNMDVQVDDTERAVRLDAFTPPPAGAAEANATILVPADLPAGPWGIAVVAELLAGDNKTVVSSSATPVRYLSAKPMLTLSVTSPDKLEGKAGNGDPGKVTGKVVRDASVTGPITVTLVGLPEGFVAPKVEIPPGAADFTLPLTFPAGTKVGELKGVRVVATAPIDPQNAANVVRSTEVGLTINVVAGS